MANFAVRVRRDATVTNVTVATITKRLGVPKSTIYDDVSETGHLQTPTVNCREARYQRWHCACGRSGFQN